jgi:hypothetical protein
MKPILCVRIIIKTIGTNSPETRKFDERKLAAAAESMDWQAFHRRGFGDVRLNHPGTVVCAYAPGCSRSPRPSAPRRGSFMLKAAIADRARSRAAPRGAARAVCSAGNQCVTAS